MKLNAKCLILLSIVAFALTGCKKAPEELAKEQEFQNKKVALEAINSVYYLGSNGFAFYVDKDNAKKMDGACFDFKPKSGKALIKFYKNPKVYSLQVKAKNELEYILLYQGNEATLKLELANNGSDLFAKTNLIIPGDQVGSGNIGNMDLVYANKTSIDHGRFNTLEECEAQYIAEDKLDESLKDLKNEGPQQ
ncbi:putative lipoprotein [Leptospira interrogans serovar Grippotyphosa str. 2006006986]|uniref:lipoprotein, tandem type n=1 Tax=Leptospira interrogans TaxID=173 RepID=UPI000292952D|nr:lipoprotein, tandem type [Leptospira interrogans]EKO89439.1 putative lipoprotein [Leptospira interrogans serovar Grippotyphosa str. Andaman]EKP85983.1 putative lipoprotein [Leptospira interrogans serovar Grippotyphosa str. 2006006986]